MKPEVQHIAITRADGGLSIMQFVTKSNFEREATDEAITEEIARAGIDATAWRRISPDDLPGDRTYRDAWVDDGKAITAHPDKAAVIDAARATVRDPLAEVDALRAMIARADSLPDLQEAIVAEGGQNVELPNA